MISEDHIESVLTAVRDNPLIEARELLRQFAADCRAQGMVDLATAAEAERREKSEIREPE